MKKMLKEINYRSYYWFGLEEKGNFKISLGLKKFKSKNSDKFKN